MRYCNACGGPLRLRVPEGDNRPRYVCERCGAIHYQNPRIIAGCLPAWEERVLLCRRAIEPRLGLWTLPAGFMENGETVEQAAARETLEEAQARVEVEALFTVFSLPRIDQVYMMYRGRLLDPEFGAGAESLEVALFDQSEVPWEALAFPTIRKTLEHYFADRHAARFGVYTGVITRSPGAG